MSVFLSLIHGGIRSPRWCVTGVIFIAGYASRPPGAHEPSPTGFMKDYPPHPPTPVPASFNPITNLHQPIPLVTVQRSASLLPINICICFCLSCCFLRLNQRMNHENQRMIRNAWISFFVYELWRHFCYILAWFESLKACLSFITDNVHWYHTIPLKVAQIAAI